MNKKFITLTFGCALMAAPLFAQSPDGSKAVIDLTPQPAADEWQHRVAPYLWIPGIKGQMGVNGIVSDVDASQSDILGNLDFGGFLAFSGKKGKWGYYADIEYLKLGSGADLENLPISEVDMSMEQLRIEAVVSYEVYESQKTSVELYGGLQFTNVDIDLEITNAMGGKISPSGSETWVDPVIGMKVLHDFNDQWFLTLVGEVGGFQVSSDLTWQVMAGVGYNINECWSIIGGYRHLYIDYEDDGFVYDADTSGPILGGVYKF
jgi:opacity protein-like surface antigen